MCTEWNEECRLFELNNDCAQFNSLVFALHNSYFRQIIDSKKTFVMYSIIRFLPLTAGSTLLVSRTHAWQYYFDFFDSSSSIQHPAGYFQRPSREKSPLHILEISESTLKATNYQLKLSKENDYQLFCLSPLFSIRKHVPVSSQDSPQTGRESWEQITEGMLSLFPGSFWGASGFLDVVHAQENFQQGLTRVFHKSKL